MTSRAEHCNVCDWIVEVWMDSGWLCVIHGTWTILDPHCDHDWERMDDPPYDGGLCRKCDNEVELFPGKGCVPDPECCLAPQGCSTEIWNYTGPLDLPRSRLR